MEFDDLCNWATDLHPAVEANHIRFRHWKTDGLSARDGTSPTSLLLNSRQY